jgi:hypothetical protein
MVSDEMWTILKSALTRDRYYWIFAITLAVGLVFVIFGGFETAYDRPVASIDGQVIRTDKYGRVIVVPDDEAQQALDHNDKISASSEPTNTVLQRESYLQKVRSWSTIGPHPVQVVLTTWWQMIISLTSPAILFAVLTTSIALAGVVFMSLTYDGILQAHGWAPKSVGLINIGAMIAAILAMAYAGIVCEPLNIWLAKRNNGIHTPEHRLVALAPACVLGFVSLLIYGLTSTSASAWGVLVSYTTFLASFIALLITTSTFAVEASPRHPGPALVMVVGTKNIVSFGTSHGLSATIGVRSFAWSFGVLAGIYGGVTLLGIPVYFLNPRWRVYMSRRRSSEHVDQS